MYKFSDRLILGCCNLSANKTKSKAVEILNYAKNLGFKFFDTAPLYSKGYSELLIGEAFKNNNYIKVTSKVGYYAIPKIFLPSSIALPLNGIKNNLKFRNNKKPKKNSAKSKKILFNNNHFIEQVKNTRKNLRDLLIDGILFHEINPFKLNNNKVDELNIYLNNLNIHKLGYAGTFQKEFTDINIPNWMKILQMELPIGLNGVNELEILKLIDNNKDKEFRFYNIFKEKDLIKKRMKGAKKILNDFPNTKIIFQTKSFERLKSNFLFFSS